MRVLVYVADAGRCGHRLIWPCEALAAQGAEVGVIRKDQPDEIDGLIERGADVIVMQRPMLRRFVESIPRVQAHGVAVVVDIDDDFTALHPGNAVWDVVHPLSGVAPGELGSQYLREACRLADMVTVTTPRLARVYGSHGRVRIVPNHVPRSMLNVPQRGIERPVVGWTGAVATHPDDLQVTRGGVARAVEAAGATFHVVGPGDGVQERLSLAHPPSSTGWVPLHDYPREMAAIGVGIVPLELTAFNEAKSYLKLMEFAALGIPAVGSPTGPNSEFAPRVGFPLASRGREWQRHVARFASSIELRADVGGKARQVMESETVEGNCGQWWDAWAAAAAKRRPLAVAQ